MSNRERAFSELACSTLAATRDPISRVTALPISRDTSSESNPLCGGVGGHSVRLESASGSQPGLQPTSSETVDGERIGGEFLVASTEAPSLLPPPSPRRMCRGWLDLSTSSGTVPGGSIAVRSPSVLRKAALKNRRSPRTI